MILRNKIKRKRRNSINISVIYLNVEMHVNHIKNKRDYLTPDEEIFSYFNKNELYFWLIDLIYCV
jgi:hypothetical protein